MHRFIFIAILLISATMLKAQNISELEKENGFLNIHFYSVKSDFDDPIKLENTNADWYRIKGSPKHQSFSGWQIESEEVHFTKDTVRDITINLAGSERNDVCKGLIDKCVEKYGKISRQIETQQETMHIWESANVLFAIEFTRDTKVTDKFTARAIYSSLNR